MNKTIISIRKHQNLYIKVCRIRRLRSLTIFHLRAINCMKQIKDYHKHSCWTLYHVSSHKNYEDGV